MRKAPLPAGIVSILPQCQRLQRGRHLGCGLTPNPIGVRGWQAVSVLAILIASAACSRRTPSRGFPEDHLISYDRELKGFLFVPPGKGPFPAILWNHGSEQLPGWQSELAHFYNQQGFVFFIPHRRGQGRSLGPYIMDRVRALATEVTDPVEAGRRFVALQDEAARDVDTAVEWLRHRPDVDPKQIVMSGCSFGGIQTLLASERLTNVKAFVAFAPGAMSWRHAPALGERLRGAVPNAKAPVLVIQAENDFDLAPSRELGPELVKRRDGSAARVFPPFGKSLEEGHGAFATRADGIAIWQSEVLAFVRRNLSANAQ